jgi:Protein tyrosine and serine/threonine kinase
MYNYAGNKDLCGPPLQGTCTSSPSSGISSSGTPTPTSSSAQNSTSVGIIVFIVVILVAIVSVLFFLKKRRQERIAAEHQHQFELPTSESNPNTNTNLSKKAEDLEAGPEMSGSSKMGSPNNNRSGGNGGHEQGRLVFVVEGRERFELPDLLKSEAEVLGSGSLGCAYKATLVKGPSMVVKKFKDMNRVGKEDFEEHMRRLGRLSHPNLLPLVAYYYRKDDKLLVTDYVPNRSLAHFLHGIH